MHLVAFNDPINNPTNQLNHWSKNNLGSSELVPFSGAPLRLSNSPKTVGKAKEIEPADLKPLINEAARRWVAAGNSDAQEGLSKIEVRLVNLPGSFLGLAQGHTILIDKNAAGYGWFVDSTPEKDSEFEVVVSPLELHSSQGSATYGLVDLLTVLVHEMGHLLGYEHGPEKEAMGETLELGVRHSLICFWPSFTNSQQGLNVHQPGAVLPAHIIAAFSSSRTPGALDSVRFFSTFPNSSFWLPWVPNLDLVTDPQSPVPYLQDSILTDYLGQSPTVPSEISKSKALDDGEEILIGGDGDSLIIGEPGKDILIGGF